MKQSVLIIFLILNQNICYNRLNEKICIMCTHLLLIWNNDITIIQTLTESVDLLLIPRPVITLHCQPWI